MRCSCAKETNPGGNYRNRDSGVPAYGTQRRHGIGNGKNLSKCKLLKNKEQLRNSCTVHYAGRQERYRKIKEALHMN